MGIEYHDGRAYYYRKRRVGGRVVSEYVAGGTVGKILATMDQAARIERDTLAGLWRIERGRMEAEDREFADYYDRVEARVREVLTAAGYHRPKRIWRKRRGKAEGAPRPI